MPQLSDEMDAEIDAAMKDLEAAGAAQPKKPRHDDVHPTRGPPSPPSAARAWCRPAARMRPAGSSLSARPTSSSSSAPKSSASSLARSGPRTRTFPRRMPRIEVVVNGAIPMACSCARVPGRSRRPTGRCLEPGQTVDARVVGCQQGRARARGRRSPCLHARRPGFARSHRRPQRVRRREDDLQGRPRRPLGPGQHRPVPPRDPRSSSESEQAEKLKASSPRARSSRARSGRSCPLAP